MADVDMVSFASRVWKAMERSDAFEGFGSGVVLSCKTRLSEVCTIASDKHLTWSTASDRFAVIAHCVCFLLVVGDVASDQSTIDRQTVARIARGTFV